MLGHKDSTVTRRVYVEEVRTVERVAKRRGRLEARMGATLAALGTIAEGSARGSAGTDKDRSVPTTDGAEVVELRRRSAGTA